MDAETTDRQAVGCKRAHLIRRESRHRNLTSPVYPPSPLLKFDPAAVLGSAEAWVHQLQEVEFFSRQCVCVCLCVGDGSRVTRRDPECCCACDCMGACPLSSGRTRADKRVTADVVIKPEHCLLDADEGGRV